MATTDILKQGRDTDGNLVLGLHKTASDADLAAAIAVATTSLPGAMSAADKVKLDGITGGGVTVSSGSSAPSDGSGSNGDVYIRTSNGAFYIKAAGAWGAPLGYIPAAVLAAVATSGAFSDLSGTNDAITNAKLANVATSTIKGRATAGTGDPEDLTASQARAVLSLGSAALVDVPSSGDASAGQAVKGDDSRLSDERVDSTARAAAATAQAAADAAANASHVTTSRSGWDGGSLNTPRTPNTSRAVLVCASLLLSVNSGTDSALVDAVLDPGGSSVTVGRVSLVATASGACSTCAMLVFIVPANVSYQLTTGHGGSGSASIYPDIQEYEL